MLERHYKKLTDDDVSYGEYRKSFAFISQFFGLPKNEIIIEWLEFEPAKNNEPERVALRYSKGLFKVNLPPDVRLIHIAPVDGITQLQPAFRSKTKGKFMYPSKRCFFTVGKAINPFKNGMVTSKNPITQIKQRAEAKIFKYTTKADKVGDVYIDPTYNQIGDSSVMIITDKPIPVMKFEDKMSQIFSSLKKMVTGNKKKDEPVEEAHIFQRGDFDEYKEYCDLDFVDTHDKVDVNLEITGINKHESNFDDLDAFMEAEVINEHDFRKFMQVCTKQFPEKYRRCISRFDEDDEEELSDFLQGYSKTLAVGYFDCRRMTRDSNVISNEILPELRKFCKEVSSESDIFKLYISDADGLDIFFDVKRKEVVKEENSWYDSESMELIESFEYDYDVLDEGALKDFIETIKNWKTSNNNHAQRSFKSNSITDEEYEELKKIIETLTSSDVKYRDYKKAFKDLCTFCHTIPTGTIITKYNLKKGDKDHNILEVEYGENTKKMKLPEGVKLFHMSKVPNIQKLIPQFRGKAERGYLYEKPRIYFTINKYMPRFLADYTKGEKVYKYEVKENIQDVYVDPLVWNISQGAVYIETNNPVPVKEVKDSLVKDVVDTVNPLKKKEEDKTEEEN